MVDNYYIIQSPYIMYGSIKPVSKVFLLPPVYYQNEQDFSKYYQSKFYGCQQKSVKDEFLSISIKLFKILSNFYPQSLLTAITAEWFSLGFE